MNLNLNSTLNLGIHTQAVHAGEAPDPLTGAVDPPIYQASTFAYETTEEGAQRFLGGEGYVYTRWGNPTVCALEQKIAALEGGEAALVTATGMAAISTALLALVRAGDHLVAARQLYSGTHHLLTHKLPELGVEVTFVDPLDPENFARALREDTRAIYIETPSNPLLEITDIAAVARIGRQAGIPTLLDNTFATPVNQRPLSLGVDVVLHSATKYLCGHGDAMGGAIIGSADFISRCTPLFRDLGGAISPLNAWLILRGMRTLPLRMRQHNENALQVARFLSGHPRVARVHYPGLPDHPGHETARSQMVGGFGGMLSFEVKGGQRVGRRVVDRLRLCTQAVSLGDARTLVSHPASTTHSILSPEARAKVGIGDGLIRLSVGLEDAQDLIADLEQALR